MGKVSIIGLYLFPLLLISSCTETKNKDQAASLTYFDIKGYFQGEAIRLTQEKPLILKKIVKNASEESKEIRIKDWNKEFSLFIESDINKPSWVSSYSVKTIDDTTIYSALSADLRIREIKVTKDADKIHSISIKNDVINDLYKSREALFYYPDSLYRIVKQQNVRVLGINDYQIIGTFIK